MRTIIFGFSRPRKWKPFSALIVWWDSYRYGNDVKISHGYTKFPSLSWNTAFIYQSSGHSTNFMANHRFSAVNEAVEEYMVEVSDETYDAVGAFVVSREGNPYALKQTLGIILIGIVWIITFGRVKLSNPFSDGLHETNCIEEQAAIMSKELGIEVPLDMDSVSVRPFRNWVRGCDKFKRVL